MAQQVEDLTVGLGSNKPLARQTKEKKTITKIRNESGAITTNSIEIKNYKNTMNCTLAN